MKNDSDFLNSLHGAGSPANVTIRIAQRIAKEANNNLLLIDATENVKDMEAQSEYFTGLKAIAILEILGCHKTAKELSEIFGNKIHTNYIIDRHSDLVEQVRVSGVMSDVASQPRNKHFKKAVEVMNATWGRYPSASKAGLCREVSKYFNNEVSIDALERWVKKGYVTQPLKTKKYTSFILVIPEGA
ncbi:hypothetical protein AE457_002851 [Salmonella enterica subsp. enterica serovar Amsterdam]|uniref:Uncharacterized protein n=1 Tax=Salmonella enterica subsp. enterica serovar Abeokuta TaxID=2926665 RepID=A0A8T9IKQ6_SALET|nr:hypothetical protein [Salmonella enterica]EAA6000267.1 hypothetical protein [Salmonella enterica subsp. enterica serovar Oranienburg]ECC3633003.1 hypothetical protein [Salmonella enterica subsp. enterica]EDI0415094.1 hypothetical protein [Salmonella enterica subsp. enterica serovar Winterthur]EEH9714144.1 hypothetical protein [Salmonella enterica subsp. enterica serovar Vancouver]EJN2872332.1 hypothetical protein [Salmonella enterica subsp. enterica serovar Techimani]QQL63710.1 hypothetica